MKIIVPMAGRGSRLRPHTLTVPKPLIPIAGKPIVHRLVQDIAGVLKQDIDEIAFIIGRDFGTQVEKDLHKIAANLGAQSTIYYQDQPLGTGHAIMCAKESMDGPIVVAYADTLFTANFDLHPTADAVIWVKSVAQPEAYGVVKMNNTGRITDFVEKPKEFVSDLAIIGIYYFKQGETLREELQYLLDNNITKGGEYQLTDALETMKQKGLVFMPGEVNEWMDCGNKKITVETNSKMLNILQENGSKDINGSSFEKDGVTIIEPCTIGQGTTIHNSTIGPNVSIGAGCIIENSTIKDTLIQNESEIRNVTLNQSMIGNKVKYNGKFTQVSLGDFTELN